MTAQTRAGRPAGEASVADGLRRAARWAFALALVASGIATGASAQEVPARATRAEQAQNPPGAAPRSPELSRRLHAAYAAKGPSYVPRTEHLRADGTPVFVNRLILEDSPYLIQHAHNPVDWYPWGPEAFEKARREGKPIFLSIGYSTCHWCHVMERESFDDVEVARVMNEGFVSIKVDREQRPDVDEVYMTAVELLTGGGGWPMSSLLTSDGKPFFGGTYLPRATFLDLLGKARTSWRDQRPQLLAQADQIATAVARVTTAAGASAEVGDEVLANAVKDSLAHYDSRLGGFSGAPKFPQEADLLFLLERALRREDRPALAAVETSLDHMARGGIFDQVGGGFHRYSTDEQWLVPHFEKMLYNQAHLARAYLEASLLTGNAAEERVARQTLDYVLRDMTSPEGGFYSATDADSEGREGAFFLWTPKEIRAALLPPDADLAIRLFGVTEQGNFEGRNILHLPVGLPELATRLKLPLADLLRRVDSIRQRLYDARERRIHPLRDEKIVTEWNAMMVTALARAGGALGEGRYLDAARRTANLLWEHNRRADGRLWRVRLAGNSSIDANQSDYAYLTEALIALYDATGERLWLGRAGVVADRMVALFWDQANGGFYMSADDQDGRLLVRPKSPTDSATPSGNSVAVRALAQLADRTGDERYRQRAQATIAAFSGQIRSQPTAFAYLLLGADELLHGGVGALEYGARGAVRVKASWTGAGTDLHRIEVALEIAPGWHVNASRPLQESLIATHLELEKGETGARLGPIEYPEAQRVSLGFQDEPLAVYQGRVAIRTTLTPEVSAIASRIRLTIQACDDRKCLRPEKLVLELPARGLIQ